MSGSSVRAAVRVVRAAVRVVRAAVRVGGALRVGVQEDHRHPEVVVDALEATAVGDQHLGLGQLHAVADLVALPPAVHGHRDGPDAHRSPESLDPSRLVDAQQPHPVAGPDPVAVGKPRGHRGRVRDVLGERGAAAIVEEVVAGRAVAAVVRGRGQQVAQAAMGAGHHAHLDAAHRLGDDLEEAARAGEHGVGLRDRHGWRAAVRCWVLVLVGHRGDIIGATGCDAREKAGCTQPPRGALEAAAAETALLAPALGTCSAPPSSPLKAESMLHSWASPQSS